MFADHMPYSSGFSSGIMRCCLLLFLMIVMLVQLPGVDPNDPSVKDLLASMQNQSEVGFNLVLKLSTSY